MFHHKPSIFWEFLHFRIPHGTTGPTGPTGPPDLPAIGLFHPHSSRAPASCREASPGNCSRPSPERTQSSWPRNSRMFFVNGLTCLRENLHQPDLPKICMGLSCNCSLEPINWVSCGFYGNMNHVFLLWNIVYGICWWEWESFLLWNIHGLVNGFLVEYSIRKWSMNMDV